MKPITYFNAYNNCVDEMQAAVDLRGSEWGIAVDNDVFARRFRRIARLHRKLHYKLLLVLGDNPGPVCWKCGMGLWEGKCRIDCYKELRIPK